MFDGEGKEVYQDGSKYEGYYKNGRKQGHGRFEWADGCWYEG
jgi:hypothetical protein